MVHTCDASTQEGQAGASEVQASQGYSETWSEKAKYSSDAFKTVQREDEMDLGVMVQWVKQLACKRGDLGSISQSPCSL